MIGKLHKELTKRIQLAKENATDEDSLLQDDEAGKENNNDNAAAAANATKPSECEDAPATDSTVVVKEGGDSDEPCTKKRLSSSS